MKARADRHLVLRLLTAAVIGFVSLTLEIAYTRVISFKLFYYYTYFVIGLALLGLGAAGAVVAVSARLRRADPLRIVVRIGPLATACGLLGYVLVARLPTDLNRIWTGSAIDAVGQLALLVVLALAITTAFFLVGLLFAGLVVDQSADVRRLYSWDLGGAALGCLAAVPLEATIGPPTMVVASLVALALLGPVVTGVTQRCPRQVARPLAVAALLGLAAAGVALVPVRTDASKTLRDDDVIAGGGWGPVFRVDAVDLGELQVLHHDGLWGSNIWRWDGSPAAGARYDRDNRQVPFGATGPDPSVLIIGAAGGNEIMASLHYGAARVVGVELNPVTVRLMRTTFAEFSGHVVDDPRVDYVEGDGRTFLARSDERYDLIWFVAPDSYAASNAATSGAFVLSESYLYTEEMIATAFDHLTPDGVMVAQFGDFDFAERPTRTARYLTTARAALSGRVDSFAEHVVLATDESAVDLERVSTIMLSTTPITDDRGASIEAAVARTAATSLRYLPGRVDLGGLTERLITGTDAEVAALAASSPFNIGPVDDDRPFFWHFSGFGDVLGDLSRSYEDSEIAIGERLLLALLAVSVAVAALLLWLPFGLTRRRSRLRRRRRLGTYFALLGLGFMLVEISMIQRFSLLLGFPTLALSVSLFTLLLATGVGARASVLIRGGRRGGLSSAVVALVVVAGTYVVVSDWLSERALAWPQWARVALVIALLFPVGLVLGAFLPTGIDAANSTGADPEERTRTVAWCWAVNGFFSVIGSTATTMVSMTFGFDLTLLAGLVLYLCAAGLGPASRRVSTGPG